MLRQPLLLYRHVLGSLLLGGACAAAFWVLSAPTGEEKTRAKVPLVIEPKSLDLGEQWETHQLVWPVEITNHGSEEVSISGFVSSCGCLGVKPASLKLAPGAKQELKLTLDLTGKPESEPLREWYAEFAARVEGGPAAVPVWRLAGKVRRGLTFSQSRLHLGERIIRGTPSESAVVRVTTHGRVEELRVESEPAVTDVRVTRERGKEDRYQVEVRAKNHLPAGTFHGTLVVKAIGPGGESKGSGIIWFHGTVLEEVQIVPAYVDFGTRTVGEWAEETVVLGAVTGKTFAVEKVEAADRTVVVEALPRKVQEGLAYRVRGQTAREGANQDRVTFVVRIQGVAEPVTLPLTLSSYGVSKSGEQP